MKNIRNKWIGPLILIGTLLMLTSNYRDAMGQRSVLTFDTLTDVDGNIYLTISIGKQVWMAQNLNTTKFNDLTSIPYVPDSAKWAELSTPGYCWGMNNPINKRTYGALYNWFTVNTGKLCPSGWHVPTDPEWTTFEEFLIENGANYDNSKTGNKYAKAMAAIFNWRSSTQTGAVGNNDYPRFRNLTHFSALPGGARFDNGTFDYGGQIGDYSYWWSSTEVGNTITAWNRYLKFDNDNLGRDASNKKDGFSIRCVKK